MNRFQNKYQTRVSSLPFHELFNYDGYTSEVEILQSDMSSIAEEIHNQTEIRISRVNRGFLRTMSLNATVIVFVGLLKSDIICAAKETAGAKTVLKSP